MAETAATKFEFTIKVNPLEIKFEATAEEGLAILQKEGNTIADAIREVQAAVGEAPASVTAAPSENGGEPEGKKRGRKPKNQPDPATASAPPPAPVPNVPNVPSIPPIETVADPLAIPPGLRREAVAAPPPPPAPVAPSFVVAGKVLAHIKAAAVDDAGKTMWANWLAQAGTIAPGATFDEAVTVLQFLPDDKAAPLAKALSL